MKIVPLCLALLSVGAAAAASAEIVLYENDNYSGRNFRASGTVSNLEEVGFNDRASSAVVRRGRWQLCGDAYFRGNCVTLDPGDYASLSGMGLNNRVSSVRELGWTPDGRGGWNDNRNYGSGNWGSGSRAILYSGYNLTGENLVVNPGGVRNLDRAGFNDKARSLRVESGYWLFCSDADFGGNCHTYGPGDYGTLPSAQNHSISSGRRVSSNYPYRDSPNWDNRRDEDSEGGTGRRRRRDPQWQTD